MSSLARIWADQVSARKPRDLAQIWEGLRASYVDARSSLVFAVIPYSSSAEPRAQIVPERRWVAKSYSYGQPYANHMLKHHSGGISLSADSIG
jgi:hypothetical protein